MACKTLKGVMRQMSTGDGRKDDKLTKDMKKLKKKLDKNFRI